MSPLADLHMVIDTVKPNDISENPNSSSQNHPLPLILEIANRVAVADDFAEISSIPSDGYFRDMMLNIVLFIPIPMLNDGHISSDHQIHPVIIGRSAAF